jgi:transglutaminase-like putative cysteine protease
MRGLLIASVLLGFVASPVLGGEQAAGKVLLDRWDAAYLQAGRAGHVHTSAVQFERDGQKLIRTTVELRLRVKRFNDTVELGMDVGDIATPEGKVVGTLMRQYLGQNKRLEITGAVAGDQLRLTLDGTKQLQPAPWNDDAVGIHAQEEMFKNRKVKAGDKFTISTFEPTVNLVLNTAVEVKEPEEVTLPGTKQKAQLLRAEIRPPRLEKVQLPTLTVWLDKSLEAVVKETEIPGLGKFRMVRTNKAGALSTGPPAQLTDIGLSQLVRLKAPIARPYDTTSAVYHVEIRDDADPASAFANDRRQQVRNVKGSRFELHILANPDSPAKQAERPGAEYTESSYFITCADPRVRALAAKAIGAESDPWAKALRIERWVHSHMESTNDEALATADHVAKTLRGDCTEYAMLTAAMCRAEGIPSRTAVGLIYANVRGQPAFAFHMWTEAWVDGRWRPLDATLGKGRIGATHLKICDQSWHEARDMTPLFPVVRVLGRIRIEVVSVE